MSIICSKCARGCTPTLSQATKMTDLDIQGCSMLAIMLSRFEFDIDGGSGGGTATKIVKPIALEGKISLQDDLHNETGSFELVAILVS